MCLAAPEEPSGRLIIPATSNTGMAALLTSFSNTPKDSREFAVGTFVRGSWAAKRRSYREMGQAAPNGLNQQKGFCWTRVVRISCALGLFGPLVTAQQTSAATYSLVADRDSTLNEDKPTELHGSDTNRQLCREDRCRCSEFQPDASDPDKVAC